METRATRVTKLSTRIPTKTSLATKLSSVKLSSANKKKILVQPAVSRPLKTITNRQNVSNAITKIPNKKETIKEAVNINIKKLGVIKKEKENVIVNIIKKESKSYSSSQLPLNVEDIDIKNIDNELLLNDYVKDIYEYLRYLEQAQSIKKDHLSLQREMTPKMRSILVDWLIKVHDAFQLLPETLYLTVFIMDRFLQKQNVSKTKIQLVGVTSLFIACKYEEIHPPVIEDLITMCDGLYHKADIIKTETLILKTLTFDLGRPSPLHFLRRFSQAAHSNVEIHTLAKYLMELSLTEYEFSSWLPSSLAATALYISLRLISSKEKVWTETIAYYTNYKEEEIQPFVAKFCQFIKKSVDSPFQNCREKYSKKKCLSISTSKYLSSPHINQMAARLA